MGFVAIIVKAPSSLHHKNNQDINIQFKTDSEKKDFIHLASSSHLHSETGNQKWSKVYGLHKS